MTLKRALILGLALIAGAAVLVFLARPVHAPPPALARFKQETRRKAPDVEFVDGAGAHHRLSDFRGRYLLLNLWATWCGPCLRELPALSRLSAEMPGRHFAVVAVALPPGSIETARRFLADDGATSLAVYYDSGTIFMRSFHAWGLPVTVLIDPEGYEIGRAVGAERWDAGPAVQYLKTITD